MVPGTGVCIGTSDCTSRPTSSWEPKRTGGWRLAGQDFVTLVSCVLLMVPLFMAVHEALAWSDLATVILAFTICTLYRASIGGKTEME